MSRKQKVSNLSAHSARPLRVAGLFAGIGGLELGFSKAGHHATTLCEIDSGAAAVLRQRFSSAELVSDVRNIEDLRGVDIVCAGFPCQDLSSVGNKRGIEGARSSLIDEVFRILRRNPAEWVVIENVRFMLHLGRGEAMRRITKGFNDLGYRWAYRVVNSLAFGLPQRRQRVFFVASKTHDPRSVLLADNTTAPVEDTISVSEPIGFYWTEGRYATGLAGNAVPPLKTGSTIGIPSPPAILMPRGLVGTPDIRDAERLQGFPAGWTEPTNDITRTSHRWKLVGNAVSVPVAEWIGHRIANPSTYNGDLDIPLGSVWPNAAWCMGGGAFASQASEWPVNIRCGLHEFLQHDIKPLSRKASDGFLRRAREGTLRYPNGFLESLQRYVENL